MNITTLCFDLDGTLLEMHKIFAYPLLAMSMYRFFPELKGLNFLKSFRQSVQALLNNTTSNSNFDVFTSKLAEYARGRDQEIVKRIVRKILSDDFPLMKCFFYPIPQNKEILLWAKQNHYRLILATNPVFPLAAIETRLAGAGLKASYFDEITHAENMTRTKPSVAYYEELVQSFSLNPSQCLMIGNDPVKDLPAAEVGMKTFLLATAKNHEKIFQISDPRLNARGSYQDLIDYLIPKDVY